MPIKDHVDNLYSLLLDEITNAVLLSDEQKLRLKEFAYLREDFVGDIYYDSTCLFITEPDDFTRLKLLPGLELSVRSEIPEYNSFLYVMKYHNNETLLKLLEHTENTQMGMGE